MGKSSNSMVDFPDHPPDQDGALEREFLVGNECFGVPCWVYVPMCNDYISIKSPHSCFLLPVFSWNILRMEHIEACCKRSI